MEFFPLAAQTNVFIHGLHMRKHAAEQGIAEEAALKKGMEEKNREFSVKGNEIYAKA